MTIISKSFSPPLSFHNTALALVTSCDRTDTGNVSHHVITSGHYRLCIPRGRRSAGVQWLNHQLCTNVTGPYCVMIVTELVRQFVELDGQLAIRNVIPLQDKFMRTHTDRKRQECYSVMTCSHNVDHTISAGHQTRPVARPRL